MYIHKPTREGSVVRLPILPGLPGISFAQTREPFNLKEGEPEMGHALLQYYESFPETEPREWDESIFGDVPWCESFDRMVPQKPNAGAVIKTFVLEADLPQEAEEDCLFPGDRVRFAHAVIGETSLDDHPLRVLAVEAERIGFPGRTYPSEFTNIAARADSYAKTIMAFRPGGACTGPAKRVLVQDVVDGSIFSVSPKILRMA